VSTVLAGFPLAAGDEILLTDHGYGAVALAVARACHRTGARAVTVDVPLDADPDTILAAITAGVTPRTALAVVDHVTSSTARRFPVERIVPALQASGVAVLVDGAHVPGMLPLDLDALAPDFWVGNFHKWACAAPGCAGLYLAPEWRGPVAPLVASWNEPFGFPYSFDQFGTTDLTSWLTLPVAFEVLGGLGWDRLRQHNGDLAAHGQAVVAEALGLDPATLVGDDGVSMRVVELPAGVGETYEAAYEVWERISAELGVEVGVNAWRGRGLLRVSAQAYNTRADYRRLADGLPLHRWPPAAGIRSG
jgi:isopenicillin-N epimerase